MMIDLHTHLLYGVDDGSESVEMSMEMLRQAVSVNITGILVTPHVNAHTTPEAEKSINNTFQALCEMIRDKDLPVELKLAAEVNLIGSEVDWTTREWVKFGGEQRYMLVETPFFQLPADYADILFKIRLKKIIPVIAHPERNAGFQKDHQTLLEWIRQGALAQVDAGSLTGMFGKPCQIFSEHLLRAGAVHLVASDAHRDQGRNFLVLGHAYKKVEELTDSETAKKLFVDNPRCLWEGRPLAPGIPDESAFKLSFVDKIRRLLSTP